ncbi:DUF11 domain-containing protein [Spirillospora sp. NPDC127200]
MLSMRRVLVAHGCAVAALLTTAAPGQADQPPAADLGVAVTASQKRAGPGDVVGFTVTVRNAGPATAPGPTVTMRLPRGLAVVDTDRPECTEQGRLLRCPLPSLAKGRARSVHILGIVKPDAAGKLRMVATARSTAMDAVPADDTAAVVLPVTPGTDLAVRLKAPASAARGARLAVTATVLNKGPRTADRVMLHFGAHKARLRTAPGDRCQVLRQQGSDQYLRCSLGTLPHGAKRKVRAMVVWNKPARRAHAQDFAVSVASARGDRSPADNVATAQVKLR